MTIIRELLSLDVKSFFKHREVRKYIGGLASSATSAAIESKASLNVPVSSGTTVASTDNGTLKEVNSGTQVTLTITDSLLPIGGQMTLVQGGAGQIALAPGAGVTLLSADGALKTRVQYSSLSIVKKATNTFYVFGDIVV